MKVFLLAGQSNMRGQSHTNKLTKMSIKNCIYYENTKNQSRIGYTIKLDSNKNIFTHGPEIGFASRMQKLLKKEKFVVVKYSENGSSLYDWDPNWTKEKAKITKTPSYGSLFNKTLRVLDSVLDLHKAQLSGICWMQGCRDSRFKGPANKYFDNFKFLIESFRNRYGNVPVVFGRVSPPNDGRFPHKDVVRLHQERAAIKIPKLTMINTDGFSKPDNLHYSLESNSLLGQKFAEKIHISG